MTFQHIINSSSVVRMSDGAVIPPDPENTDWQAYQAWITLGNMAEPAAAPADASLVSQARAALVASDRTVLRCVEAGLAVPADWHAFRNALRSVIAGRSATLPQQPDYPADT